MIQGMEHDLADAAESQEAPSTSGGLGCWARGGCTVRGLQREFNDPGWALRGQYRVLKQFIMNWNNWPSPEDRSAMLDGPPPSEMPMAQQARIAAVVRCLCERDGHPVPAWVHTRRASRRGGGVRLTSDRRLKTKRLRPCSGFAKILRQQTPPPARRHRVWFEADLLESR